MKEWSYLQFTLLAEHYDVASGILWELGTIGIEEKNSKGGWIRLRAYFDSLHDTGAVALQFETACRRAGILPKALTLRRQREKDWLKMGRVGLKPFPIGNHFYIIPAPELSGELPENRFPLWLQPGMAFGTGTHESTQLCLEVLEQMSLKGKKLLDIGTGSGILAIAAVKLGCRKAVACDIDLDAIRTARANGVINQCDREIEWVPGSVPKIKSGSFDVIVANLTVEIILTEIDAIHKRLGLGGSLILSGILDIQSSRVRQALKAIELGRCRTRHKGEWVCLIAVNS
jgi:ribosomal protein L11 methyltransferase